MCEHSQRQLDETRQENKVIFLRSETAERAPLSNSSSLAIEEVQVLSPILTTSWSRGFLSSTLRLYLSPTYS